MRPRRAAQAGRKPTPETALRAIILCCLLIVTALADTSDYFSRANDEYEAGRFDRALLLYDSALATLPSAAVYYNRGNTWFRLGNIGRAIADYNRSYALAPRDRYIRHNLAFARQFRPDRSLVQENPFLQRFTEFLRLTDIHTARLIGGAAFLLGMAGFAVFLAYSRRPFLWLGILLILAALYGIASALSWNSFIDPGRAVVVVPELTLRAGPGSEYKEIAVVHDGLEVTVRERRFSVRQTDSLATTWTLLQIPGGLGGWAEASAIEHVFPR